MFGRVLNDEDLQDELDKLDAMILEEALPSAPDTLIQPAMRQVVEEPANVA